MPSYLKIQGMNIVLRGDFNPTIFHPAWLAALKLIRQQEAEAADIKIIHPDMTAFDVDWLQIRIGRDRFQVTTVQEAYYEVLRDLVIGILTVLDHTPLRAMGINRDFHYELDSEKTYHTIGHRLTPKQDWNEVLDNPGMVSLTIEGTRSDEFPGFIRVKVEPSAKIPSGVYIESNDHYVLPSTPDKLTEASETAVNILRKYFLESMERSLRIGNKIASLGEAK